MIFRKKFLRSFNIFLTALDLVLSFFLGPVFFIGVVTLFLIFIRPLVAGREKFKYDV